MPQNVSELGKTGLLVSPVGLGTVEIGLPYDIASPRLPSDAEAEKMLKAAVELGVTYIDTARGYGVAEARIGKSGIGKMSGVVIGTKCAQFLEKGEDLRGVELAQRIREEVETSLRALQTESLQLLQLHGGTAEQIERGEIIEIMQKLKNEGKIQHAGIAVRGVEAARAALESNFFETIQLAYSILDQRMAAEIFPLSIEKNIGIINRSVLLKGVLTDKRHVLSETLAPLQENAGVAAEIAQSLGMPLPDLAVSFAAGNPAITTILIGTTKPEHLESALAATQKNISSDTLALLQDLALTDPAQVDPSQWA